MDNRFFDEVAEAFNTERDRWGSRFNQGEAKPYEVFRTNEDEKSNRFSELKGFTDPIEANLQFRQLRDRAAATAAVLLVMDSMVL